jgi:hypothetical protein
MEGSRYFVDSIPRCDRRKMLYDAPVARKTLLAIGRAALPALIAACSSACFAMMGGSARQDDTASRCKQGLDMFENARCQPGQAGSYRVEFIRYELEAYRKECRDAASLARLDRIDQACVPMYRVAQEKRVDDRRQVRARSIKQVSDLLLDPAYGPAADRYKDLQEQSFSSEDPRVQAALGEAKDVLANLARKHGIDPTHARELELW